MKSIQFAAIIAATMLLAGCPGDDCASADCTPGDTSTDDTSTDDTSTDDTSTGDTSTGDPPCAVEDVCQTMVDAGFYAELQLCLDWFGSDGTSDPACADFGGFYACACDCVGMTPANAEFCLGQCNSGNCM